MNQRSLNGKYALQAANIDVISEQVASFLTEKKIEHKEIIRLRMSMENVLLDWQESLGEDTEVELTMSAHFGKVNVELACPGQRQDPFAGSDELDDWTRSLRMSLENVPEYEYISHTNIVSFRVHKPQISRLLVVMIHLALGIVIGFAGFLLPEELRTSICDNVITPIYNAYITLFGFCGVPLIFLAIVTGVLGVGSIRSFHRIGQKMVKHFLLTTLSVIVFTLAVGVAIFRPDLSGGSGSFQYADFLSMILGWIPSNVVQPFIDCSAMQLVLLGVGFSVAILLLGRNRMEHISGFLLDMDALMLEFSRWFAMLIPACALIMIVYTMWQSEIPMLLAVWKNWVITILLEVITLILLLPVISKKYNVSIGQLLKKVRKIFLIALGTNSCAASIGANYESCGAKLGVDDRIFSFGIPVGTTICKPATAVRLIVLCLFTVTVTSPMSVSVGWLLVLGIMAFVLSIAVPAIPGGTLMLCTMLFTQLDIPTSLLAAVLTTDVFFDCIGTAINQIAVTYSLTSYAASVDMLDESILKQKE